MSSWGDLEADFQWEPDPETLLKVIERELEERIAPTGSEEGPSAYLGNKPGSTFHDPSRPVVVHVGGSLRDMDDTDSVEVFAWWASHAMQCPKAELLWAIQGYGPQYGFLSNALGLYYTCGLLFDQPDFAPLLNALGKRAREVEDGGYGRLDPQVYRDAAQWVAGKVGYA